ncbi:MAG: hypothetical protein M1833_006556 [Piccolia ochrophora]|nr:MAG: hypothetical protein M1833_006556 [Piccolia ochrophora]
MELVGLGERATRELTQTLHGWVEWAEQQHCRTENIPVDSYLQELLNREFIANLEHLIRRYLGWLLNFFVRQVLLQKLLIAILKHLSNTFETLDTSFSYIAYDPLLADSYIEGSPQELWNYRQEQPSNTQSGLSGTATGDEETRHWAAAGSVQYSTLTPSVSSPQPITPSIQIQGPDVVDNIPISPFPPRNGSSFDEAFCQYLSHLELGSPMHTNLPSPTSTHVDDDYQRTDFSEGSCPNASPAMEKSSPITPPRTRMMRVSSEGSSKGNPPRNEDNKMFCDHDECASDPPIFERRCEWSKHKDKHERPYHCEDPNCAKLQGFTYSGGLLRHQREVHREHGGPKEALMCPYDNCKRSSGAGFTRKENLNEHLRRVHKQSTVEGGVAWHDGAEALSPSRPDTVTQLPSTASAASLERKRKRSMAATGGSPSAARASSFRVDGGDEDLRAEFKRLKQSYEQISLQLHQLQEHTGFVQG